ncbi:GNAT family N-acetyltransferase [Jannaschia formosa]|uniref:GNAT family N-acetyltransferase n=1 Tax=Jannaschia formosa TaxID=2259592 RepID=UPI000E1B7F6A|nr:GNAT family N-acetyltransferase [Jannaschia formosa]TFL19191.1 N-acetyltransferase [Jannaschia formosa]
MTRLHVRPARPFDAGAMATLLNAIIAQGGTTAMTEPVTGADLRDWMQEADIWHVAESDGEILGFQWIGRHPGLPEDACDIATFVALGSHGLGVGSRLFDATRAAAKAAGFAWIAARIAPGNEGGQAYYRSRGFEDWLRTGDKVIKRFDL